MSKGIPIIQQWVTCFKRDRPLPDATVSVRDQGGLEKEEGFCLSAIADIEESVWAPKYGLKGMIDASVEATFVASRPEKVRLLETKVSLLLALKYRGISFGVEIIRSGREMFSSKVQASDYAPVL